MQAVRSSAAVTCCNEVMMAAYAQERHVLFTDGVTEAGPHPEAFFERSGVEAAARDLWSLDASAIGDGSFDAVLRHAEGHVNDDATIVVVKLTGIDSKFD